MVLQTIGALVHAAHAFDDAAGFGIGEHAGDHADFRSAHTGDLGGPFGCACGDGFGQFVKPMAVFFDKLFVIQPFLDDHVDHGLADGSVRARARLQENTVIGDGNTTHIDGDQGCAGFDGITNDAAHGKVTFIRVAAPEDDTIGVGRFFNRIAAKGDLAGQDAGAEAVAFSVEEVGAAVGSAAKRWLKAAISKCSTPTEPV